MDEGCAIPLVINPLKINDEFGRIFPREGHNLSAEQGDNMVRDDLLGLILKISVVDSEIGVEPVNFVFDKVLGNKPLSQQV